MSGLDKSYGVRIKGTDAQSAAELAQTIGPVVDRTTTELVEALTQGPAVVATELGFEEAEQFANVLANMGATPEVIQQVQGSDTWLPIPFERTPPPGEIADTVAMDLGQVRARLEALQTGPPVADLGAAGGDSTMRFDPEALRDGLGMDVGSLPPIVLNQVAEFGAPPQAGPPPKVTATVEVSLGVVDSRVDVEELSQAALDRALREEAERLKAAGAPVPDDINLEDPDSTQRFDRPGERPQRGPGLATTQRFGKVSPTQPDPAQDTRATTNFRRPGASDIMKTSSFGERELGALVLRMEAPEVSPTASGFMPTALDVASAANELPELLPQESTEGGPVRFTVVPTEPTPAPRVTIVDDSPFEPPEPELEAPHSPTKAAFLALIPGMGQVYNGERERGVWFALGAVLVVPWIYGIIDAWMRAVDIVRGRRARPLQAYARSAALAHIALVMSIVCGVALGRAFLPYLRPPPEPVPEQIVVERRAPKKRVVRPKFPQPPPRPAMDQGEVESLLLRGRDACDRGLFTECELLVEAILESHPDQADALKLLARANSGQK